MLQLQDYVIGLLRFQSLKPISANPSRMIFQADKKQIIRLKTAKCDVSNKVWK